MGVAYLRSLAVGDKVGHEFEREVKGLLELKHGRMWMGSSDMLTRDNDLVEEKVKTPVKDECGECASRVLRGKWRRAVEDNSASYT